MRVLLITQWHPKRGGIVTHVENMMKHSTCEFSIITYPKFADLPFLRPLGLIVYGFVKGLQEECDVIHAHYAVPQGLLGVLLKLAKRRPLVVTVHGSDITVMGRRRLTRPLVTFTLRNADIVVAVSNFLKAEVLEMGVPDEKIHVVYNGLRVNQEEREDFRLPGVGPVVTFIGSLVYQKGVDVLLRAFYEVKTELSNSKLAIIGKGSEGRKLEAFARKLRLRDVYFLGERKDLATVLEKSSVLVLPSREEGFGMVLLEAMHAGVPVVASNTGGIPEIVLDQMNGVLVERENPEALSAGILSVLNDASLREKLVRNGREMVKKFSWEKASKEVDLIYDEVVERAHR